jgi:hypothetical protein
MFGNDFEIKSKYHLVFYCLVYIAGILALQDVNIWCV